MLSWGKGHYESQNNTRSNPPHHFLLKTCPSCSWGDHWEWDWDNFLEWGKFFHSQELYKLHERLPKENQKWQWPHLADRKWLVEKCLSDKLMSDTHHRVSSVWCFPPRLFPACPRHWWWEWGAVSPYASRKSSCPNPPSPERSCGRRPTYWTAT